MPPPLSMGASNYRARRSTTEAELVARREAGRHGLATTAGFVAAGVELLERLVRRVPGVITVASSVAWRVDDTTRRGRATLTRPA